MDLDAHQGNGNAEIFQNDKNIFTYSAHREFGYPEKREKSSLDIELPLKTKDEAYYKALKDSLPSIAKVSNFDLVFYIAGADIYEKDLLGGMKVSMAGIQKRDKWVFEILSTLKIPTVLTFAGGYAENIEDTAQIYLNTVSEALKTYLSFNKLIHF